jgi:hypothetical protein
MTTVMAWLAHRRDHADRVVDALELAAPVALHQHAERTLDPRLHRLRRGEDVLADAVAHIEDPRRGLQLLERLRDPACFSDEVDG